MMAMDQHTLGLLEFQKIRDELCGYCFSNQGRELMELQTVLTDPQEVKELLDRSVAMRALLDCGDNPPPWIFPM